MSGYIVLAAIVLIGIAGYFFGARRAVSQRRPGIVSHSLPGYHGWMIFIFAVVPSLLFLLVWSIVSTSLVEGRVHAEVASHVADPAAASLSVGMVHNVAGALAQLDARISKGRSGQREQQGKPLPD